MHSKYSISFIFVFLLSSVQKLTAETCLIEASENFSQFQIFSDDGIYYLVIFNRKMVLEDSKFNVQVNDSQKSEALPDEIMVGKDNITGGDNYSIEMTEGGGFARYIELK